MSKHLNQVKITIKLIQWCESLIRKSKDSHCIIRIQEPKFLY